MAYAKGKGMPPADISSWAACIFQHFDGTDGSWQSVCGLHPEGRISPAVAGMAYLCESGNAVLISSTYLCNPSVWRTWFEWLGLRRFRVTPSQKYSAGSGDVVRASSVAVLVTRAAVHFHKRSSAALKA